MLQTCCIGLLFNRIQLEERFSIKMILLHKSFFYQSGKTNSNVPVQSVVLY